MHAGAHRLRLSILTFALPRYSAKGARKIAPAQGKLGVLCVGLGAVATTFMAGVEAAAEPTTNVMPVLLDAVRAYATEGEIVDALADVFGRHTETPVV